MTNEDFEIIISGARIPELDEGHQCFPLSNPLVYAEAGSNATLQIRYISDFDDDGRNETYYACADITYVPTSQFTYQVPCFNATIDDFNVTDSSDRPSASSSQAAVTETATANSATQASNGLSNGAIAGIVVGVLVGIAIAVASIFFLLRRSQQIKRQRAQEASVRNVKWVDSSTSQSGGSGDMVLENLKK